MGAGRARRGAARGDLEAFPADIDDLQAVLRAGFEHSLLARLMAVELVEGRDYGNVTPLRGLCSGGASQSLGVAVEVMRLA